MKRRVLFLQVADPGYYPPIMHAAALMADAGFDVHLLSAPVAGSPLTMPRRAGVTLHAVAARPTHVVGKAAYGAYTVAALRLARALRPDLVYASDTLCCGPALLAARMTGAKLLYHEHDTPDRGGLNPVIDRFRQRMLRNADLVVFPNAERARRAHAAVGGKSDRFLTVWNLPQRDEVADPPRRRDASLVVHYHGNVSRDLVPETAVAALLRMGGRAKLNIVGYEAPGAAGHVAALRARAAAAGAADVIDYRGAVAREDLLAQAAEADVGLALMPMRSDDVNMRFMAGASNKPFDYMAAGLCLLVSDLPDWVSMFVAPGYGRAVDPGDADSLHAALEWFAAHPEERQAMAARARARIAADWNYETAFAPVLERIGDG